MPFGLFNILPSFQGYINKILAKKLNIFVIFYLDNIFIYTKNPRQPYVDAVWSVFKELKKNVLFANLTKSRFYMEKVCFLEYVMSAQRVQIKDKKIEKVKNWPKSKSVRDI